MLPGIRVQRLKVEHVASAPNEKAVAHVCEGASVAGELSRRALLRLADVKASETGVLRRQPTFATMAAPNRFPGTRTAAERPRAV